MPDRLTQLNFTHYRIMTITCLIGFVTALDFWLYWNTFEYIAHNFLSNIGTHSKQLWQGLLFVSAYIAQPLGGLLLGWYGDKYGRKPVLFACLIGISLLSIIIALLPNDHTIGVSALLLFMVVRILQGIFFGAQHPVAWVYVVESLPTRNIGIGCGVVVAGIIFSSNAVYFLINLLESIFTYQQMLDFGWRLPFLASGMLGLLLALAHRFMDETPVFLSYKAQDLPVPKSQQTTSSPLVLTMKKRWQATLMILVLSWIMSSIVIIITFLLADSLRLNFLITDNTLDIGMQLSIFFMVLGALFFGLMTDTVNVAKVLIIGGVLLIVSLALLTFELHAGASMALPYFALVGFFGGIVGALPSVMTRLLLVKFRLSTFAIYYHWAYSVIGLVLPFMVGYLSVFSASVLLAYLIVMIMLITFCSFYLYYQPRSHRSIHNFE